MLSQKNASGEIDHCSVNACLRPLLSMAGQMVTTTEGIGNDVDGYKTILGKNPHGVVQPVDDASRGEGVPKETWWHGEARTKNGSTSPQAAAVQEFFAKKSGGAVDRD